MLLSLVASNKLRSTAEKELDFKVMKEAATHLAAVAVKELWTLCAGLQHVYV